MAINILNSKWIALAMLSLAAVSGCCCQAVPLPGECDCPTDARRLYLNCGEEAVRRCPCGPDHEYYGLKPTCWRAWPEGWHCNGCEGHPYVDRGSCGEPVAELPVAEAPASVKEPDLSNPFRSKPGAAELPLPPQARDMAPAQTPPAKAAPVLTLPPQPTPTAPPALEMVPQDTAPVKEAPIETSPAVKKPANEKPAAKATSAVIEPSKIPEVIPAVVLIPEVEVTAPLPMPIVPAALKMTAAPILIPPQNCQPQISAAKPNSPVEHVASAPKAEKKQTDKDRAEDPAMSNRVEQHLLNNLQL